MIILFTNIFVCSQFCSNFMACTHFLDNTKAEHASIMEDDSVLNLDKRLWEHVGILVKDNHSCGESWDYLTADGCNRGVHNLFVGRCMGNTGNLTSFSGHKHFDEPEAWKINDSWPANTVLCFLFCSNFMGMAFFLEHTQAEYARIMEDEFVLNLDTGFWKHVGNLMNNLSSDENRDYLIVGGCNRGIHKYSCMKWNHAADVQCGQKGIEIIGNMRSLSGHALWGEPEPWKIKCNWFANPFRSSPSCSNFMAWIHFLDNTKAEFACMMENDIVLHLEIQLFSIHLVYWFRWLSFPISTVRTFCTSVVSAADLSRIRPGPLCTKGWQHSDDDENYCFWLFNHFVSVVALTIILC